MDIYSSLSFVSGVAITTLAFILLLVRIEPDEESRKIRFARAILAASYFLLAVPDWLNIYGLNDSEDIAAATIVSVSIQSLLFTFTLITMIQPSLVTMRRILINVALVAVGSLCFLVVDSLSHAWRSPLSLSSLFFTRRCSKDATKSSSGRSKTIMMRNMNGRSVGRGIALSLP